jgi:putative DNA primase/helicase
MLNVSDPNIQGSILEAETTETLDLSLPLVETPPPLSDEEQLKALAKLSILEYDRIREATANAMGIRVSALDKALEELKNKAQKKIETAFEEVQPHPLPVNGAELLSEVAATIQRFIVCPPETANAAALWTAMTWFMDVVDIAPLAVITAPEKRCGKSQLLTLLGKLAYQPLTASRISAAAVYRTIEAWKPTLFIDEADTFMAENEALRGILNSGHTRDSAYVVLIEGDEHQPKRFNTWGAKAIAGIGTLQDTLMDRAIKLELRRKRPEETVERLRHAHPDTFSTLTAKFARFAADNGQRVRYARPNLPNTLNDRAQDNWEPLLAIADTAGRQWPHLAKEAALVLSGETDTLSDSAELLQDIQTAFGDQERLTTDELINALCKDTEAPWATYNKGKPITPQTTV